MKIVKATMLATVLLLLVGGAGTLSAYGAEGAQTADPSDDVDIVERGDVSPQPASKVGAVSREESESQALATSHCGSSVETTFDPMIPLLNWGGGLCGAPPACNMPCTTDQYCKVCCNEPDQLSICHQPTGCCLC